MGDITFTPAACIYYHSKTGRSGHYTAIIRTNENKYYHVNDGEVSENESWSLNINPQDTPPKVIAVFMANKGVFLKTELKKPIGIINPGNTCFFNSLIQCLIHVDIIDNTPESEPQPEPDLEPEPSPAAAPAPAAAAPAAGQGPAPAAAPAAVITKSMRVH